jgi:cytochrome c2
MASTTGAFVVALAAMGFVRRQRTVTLLDATLTGIAATGLAMLSMTVIKVTPSAGALVLSSAGSVFLMALLFWLPGLAKSKVALLLATNAAAATLLALIPFAAHRLPPAPTVPKPTLERSFFDSSLYGIESRRYVGFFPGSHASGGGIALLPQGYLLATGDGALYGFHEDRAGQTLAVTKLNTQIPVNRAEFEAATSGMGVKVRWFRTIDIVPVHRDRKVLLLASHHYWNGDQDCVTLRVSQTEIDLTLMLDQLESASWHTVFESSPCLPLKPRGSAFGGNQAGGRMALRDGQLLLSVGDFEFDGVNSDVAYPQDAAASYGKILSVDLGSGTSRVFSLGLRNPQGLFLDSSGSIWETEHGPQGGDEVNRIEEGNNYGWPLVTYGTNYAAHDWPLSAPADADERFAEPIFAWVPSIGVSNLIAIQRQSFARWRGDLVATSLKDRSLWRLKLREGRPVLTERILIGHRIRDLLEGHNGEIVLWLDEAEIAVLEPVSGSQSGALMWAQCKGCHVMSTGTDHGIGPDLLSIVGRDVAGAPDYDYSDGMRELGGAWSEERLDAFLANPRAFVPGTSMQFEGIPDAAARGLLISYLKSQSAYVSQRDKGVARAE